jgi:hypothetical protein
MLLSSKRTALAEVCMPCPFDEVAVLFDNCREFTQRTCVKAIAGRNASRRVQPEFGFAAIASAVHMHMHMHRLARIAFIGLEEESESLVAKHARHG